jgi:hypothetical protein
MFPSNLTNLILLNLRKLNPMILNPMILLILKPKLSDSIEEVTESLNQPV